MLSISHTRVVYIFWCINLSTFTISWVIYYDLMLLPHVNLSVYSDGFVADIHVYGIIRQGPGATSQVLDLVSNNSAWVCWLLALQIRKISGQLVLLLWNFWPLAYLDPSRTSIEDPRLTGTVIVIYWIIFSTLAISIFVNFQKMLKKVIFFS